jgi:hypothetical protein
LNHHLYGAGNNENLVPITGSLNTTMSANVEEPLKEAVFGKSQILRYRVKVNFDGHPDPARRIPEELYLPSSITLEADEIEAEGSGWKTKRSIYNNTLNNTLPSDKDPIDVVPKLKRLSINNPHGSPGDPDAKVALKKLPQVSDTRAELLLFHTGRFRKWSDVNDYLHYTDLFEHHWERHPNEVDSGRLVYLDGDTIWIYPP